MLVLMEAMGNPTVDRNSFWHIYRNLLHMLQSGDSQLGDVAEEAMNTADQMMEVDQEAGRLDGHHAALGMEENVVNVGRVNIEGAHLHHREEMDDAGEETEDGSDDDGGPTDDDQVAVVDEMGRLWIPDFVI